MYDRVFLKSQYTKNQNRLYLFDSIYYCVSHVATRSILSLFLALFFFSLLPEAVGLDTHGWVHTDPL